MSNWVKRLFLRSYLFIEFDKFWLECQPRDIMEFNRIRDLFENNVRSQLQDPRTCFKVNIQVDTVWPVTLCAILLQHFLFKIFAFVCCVKMVEALIWYIFYSKIITLTKSIELMLALKQNVFILSVTMLIQFHVISWHWIL